MAGRLSARYFTERSSAKQSSFGLTCFERVVDVLASTSGASNDNDRLVSSKVNLMHNHRPPYWMHILPGAYFRN